MDRFERWREVIQVAADENAVAEAVRGYVASISPTVFSLFPPDCQRALGISDIQNAAITLMHCELTYGGDPAVAPLLHQVAQAYASASQRIAQLSKGPLDARIR